jgi:predicted regulator of amino acid metabolism with ACT domain
MSGERDAPADRADGTAPGLRTDGGTPEEEATFDAIMEKFADSPSQQAVIRLLLERGFSVNDEGRVVSGGIEIPNTGIAREVDVDRRVVDATTDAILADDQLRRIFQNISAIPSLMDLAPVLDLSALAITVRDAEETGIVATVTGAIADRGISIRQTISEDPEFTDEPKLYVITDGEIPGDLLTEIRAMEFVHSIELR